MGGLKLMLKAVSENINSKSTTKIITANNLPRMAVSDLLEGLRNHQLWWVFAVHDIKQRFRRSMLGPFWLTLSMGIFVGSLGFVMSQLFDQDIKIFVPYLATGIIFWTLLTTIITEGCASFIAAEGYIKNVPMPLSVHFYRMVARNSIIWLHNMVIYLCVFALFIHAVSLNNLLFIPGFILFLANAIWIGLMAAILSTRYRDIPQVITSFIQVVFFVTPIFWSVATFPERPAFVDWNPCYHLLEIVRAPLLGQTPHNLSWLVATGLLSVGLPITLYLYRRAYARIPYWV